MKLKCKECEYIADSAEFFIGLDEERLSVYACPDTKNCGNWDERLIERVEE